MFTFCFQRVYRGGFVHICILFHTLQYIIFSYISFVQLSWFQIFFPSFHFLFLSGKSLHCIQSFKSYNIFLDVFFFLSLFHLGAFDGSRCMANNQRTDRSERERKREREREWVKPTQTVDAASVSGEEYTRWKVGDPGKMTLAGCEAKGGKWMGEGQGNRRRGGEWRQDKLDGNLEQQRLKYDSSWIVENKEWHAAFIDLATWRQCSKLCAHHLHIITL